MICRAALAFLLIAAAPPTGEPLLVPAKVPTVAEVIAAAPPRDWIAFEQDDLFYMMLANGHRVVIALIPSFAPATVANIKRLAAAHWWDGTSVNRVQDDYVAQWGDATEKKPLPPGASKTVPYEGDGIPDPALPRTPVPGPDGYAADTGYVAAGWPVARDPASGRAWLVHCYGMVGVGRDEALDSGDGAELYAVIGASPRNLDRNVTLVGRVVDGIERLSSLPRGTGALGFYEKPEQRVPIRTVRLGTEVPRAEQLDLLTLRAGSQSFAALVAARANRSEAFFAHKADYVDLCNVRSPVMQKIVQRVHIDAK